MYFASIWQGYILEEKMRQQSVTDKVKLEDPNISHWYAHICSFLVYFIACHLHIVISRKPYFRSST